jgi:transcriptional regulator GlxA family with amidase domain
MPRQFDGRGRAARGSSREIVERTEAYVRAHIDSPIPLSTLCRLVGLSERSLRNAFYSVRGVSPKRSLLADRLLAVRNALREAKGRTITVTNVATGHGFYELGRFAASYKEAFGEAPSETLRSRARSRVCGRHIGPAEEYAHVAES